MSEAEYTAVQATMTTLETLHSFYINAIDLTTIYQHFNVLFQHFYDRLAASRTLITFMPIDEVKHSVK